MRECSWSEREVQSSWRRGKGKTWGGNFSSVEAPDSSSSINRWRNLLLNCVERKTIGRTQWVASHWDFTARFCFRNTHSWSCSGARQPPFVPTTWTFLTRASSHVEVLFRKHGNRTKITPKLGSNREPFQRTGKGITSRADGMQNGSNDCLWANVYFVVKLWD